MKLVLRAKNKVQLTLIQPEPEIEQPHPNPQVITPLDTRHIWQSLDRGLNDMPVIFRGDGIPIEVTLLDFRGNPLPELSLLGVVVELAVKQVVPVPVQLFVKAGTVTDPVTGKVYFSLSATDTDQAGVDEALMNIRVTPSGGEPITFEDVSIFFKDSAFT